MPSEFSPESLPNRFDFAQAQARIYREWEARGLFHAEPPKEGEPDTSKGPYCIVIPPPNVTGALHLGHALNNTLQDIQIRMRRMQGYNTLWMPGTDHAGIATQAVVEKRLREEEGLTRHQLGREGLVQRIWQWKEVYEKRILDQLRQMGCSCDWARTRFTFDEGCSRAVRQTFFDLFSKGLIYRGKRLVNWDTFLQTAVSDDEVFHETVKGHFWHFRYQVIPEVGQASRLPEKESSDEPTFVEIATTRPETMLGDTAVAVHPDPAAALNAAEAELRERLSKAPAKERDAIQAQIDDIQHRRREMLPLLEKLRDMALAGRKVMLPLVNREIPLICDEWARPELGTGCVKITPAHDPNDYDVWQRHKEIGAINILNPDGTLNESAGPYRGLTIYKARDKVVADLDALGLLGEVEDREIDLAHSDRSKTPIEPYLADQWFVKMSDHDDGRPGLAQMAMDAVRGPLPRGPLPRGPLAPQAEALRGPLALRAEEPRSALTPPPGQPASQAASAPPPLAERADHRGGRVNIVPPRYAKSYLDWLSEKRDWPVSRQLWWGHQIPIWTIKDMSAIKNESNSENERRDNQTRTIAELNEYLSAAGVQDGEYVVTSADNWDVRCCVRTERAQDALHALKQYLDSFLFAEVKRGQPAPMALSRVARFEGATEVARKLEHIDELRQDPDVLDTWFSSALWPHSTLGWPERTRELDYWYPTSVLITSRDIITLWVARMVLTGLNNMGEVPFREVFIHPKILDGYGETMSKMKGNGVDPVDVISKFGADSLRFGLASMTTETQDVRMPVQYECPHCNALIDQTKQNRSAPRVKCPKCNKDFSTQWAHTDADRALPRAAVVSERFEVARNFMNKLWNAARFSLINLADSDTPTRRASEEALELTVEDRWLLSRLATVTKSVTEALESYRYADAAKTLYDFAWDEFCSFYVEIAKARLADDGRSRPPGGTSGSDETSLVAAEEVPPGRRDLQPAEQVPPGRRDLQSKAAAQRVLAHALDTLLRLLHPIMPFITEEVWQLLNQVAPQRGLDISPDGTRRVPSTLADGTWSVPATWLITAPWPEADLRWQDPEIEARFAVFQQVLGAVREIRSRQNIATKTPLNFAVKCDPATAALLEPMRPYFQSMTNASAAGFGPEVAIPPTHAKSALAGLEIFVDLAGLIDVDAERSKNEQLLQKLSGLIKGKETKLANERFVSRAPANVVQAERDSLAQLQEQLASVRAALAALKK